MDQVPRLTPFEPINLATVPDFDLGALLVQPSLRRVSAGGREESVEPRVMQALIALTQAGGTVMSRDLLIDRCWGGRIVGDDAINRCIAKVRKLAELAEPPAFTIETVAKVGYLLKLPPVAIPQGFARASGTVRPPRRPARLWAWGLLGLAAIGGAGAAMLLTRPQARWTVRAGHNLVPELAGETSPRISPNGALLAYVVGAESGHGRIFVRSLHGGKALAVSAPGEDAASPAWAPDNVHLAYVVSDPLGGPCRFMSTVFPGGTPFVAGKCLHTNRTGVTWQQDARFLLFTDDFAKSFGAIFRLDVETGQSEQVTSPRPGEFDYGPAVSPDGHWLAYIRSRGFIGQALRLRNLTTGDEREIPGNPDINSFDWAPDSQTLIAGASSMMGSEILAYPIDGGPAYQVYASAADLGQLTIGPDGTLAAVERDERYNLARAHATQSAVPDILDAAAGVTYWPAFSRDDTLAFVSNRSGERALWVRKPGGEPVELYNAGFKDIERPVWSPDGSRIAFFEVWKGDVSVHVMTAQGDNVVAFPVQSIGFGMPNWTPDGEHLVLFERRILQAVSVDLRNPGQREPVAGKLWDGVQYWHGATYSIKANTPGIWQIDGSPRLVTAHYPAAHEPRLTFSGDDVLIPGPRIGRTLQIMAQPLRGGEARVAYYAPSADPDTPFAVDPVTGDVIYVTEEPAGSHIDLLTIARQ